MIENISFKNYKSFKDEQSLDLKPITILIGKNSTGKSALTKLPVLIDNSFNNVTGEPYTMSYDDVQFGGEYRDLFYGRIPNAELEFKLSATGGKNLTVKIVSDYEKGTIPRIISWKLNNTHDLQYNPTGDTYTNLVDSGIYKCVFDGFNLTSMHDSKNEEVDFLTFSHRINIKTNYVGPFRVYADSMRFFQLRSFRQFASVGVNGEDAYYILGVESLKPQSELIKSVSEWYQANFDGWGIKVNNDLQPHCSILLTREDKKFDINIADVGQGMSQALPLVVSAFLPGSEHLNIIEQPELHLHPGAHGNLAELFAESTIKLGKKYLIETHSQNFILRLRRMIAENRFSHEDLKIYWVDYNGDNNASSLKTINVNKYGEVDFWPENIFTETLDETIAIRTAQKERKDADRI